MPELISLSRRRWLASTGTAVAGLALSGRFLNEEMRAQTMSPERLAAAAPGMTRLSLNENPLGPSPAAVEAMQRLIAGGRSSRYAFVETNDLIELIARREGVTPDHIVLGVGSGEILETVGVHFGLAKGEVIYATPGYLQLPRALEAAGGKAIAVPLNAKMEHDLDAMASRVGRSTSIVYLANPHNPTGTVVEPAALRAFVQELSTRTFVFVDEAYLDIADNYDRRTMVGLVNNDRPLLVARTFSKIYGLAGLRIGYGVTTPRFAEQLRTYSLGSLGGPSVAAAIASLKDDAYVANMRTKIVAERQKLLDLLRELGRPYAEPQTNFVFFNAGRPHAEMIARMQAEGVAIARAFPPLLDWVRLTIGLPEENAHARKALRAVLARP